ncbi:peptide-methionine (R)-S-oxide reductase MsrB [Streptomyces sp. NPDC006333]|uniref:peptide-methionine (R)-S-oxide reductase MsrB n=1 Tax=Streptomyces sp. NPDC006333 TaxID=3156753 RepID=UPI0033AC112D
MSYEIEKPDEQWRAELLPAEYQVLRQAATEMPFTGEYTDIQTRGVYSCRACGAELFTSEQKFEAGCGWPSFFDPKDTTAVELAEDGSYGEVQTEVRCARCGSHLGHVFEGEGFPTPTDQRYCINSISLRLRSRCSIDVGGREF